MHNHISGGLRITCGILLTPPHAVINYELVSV